MWSFGAICDDFLVATRLAFKLELEPSRETVMHFLEQLRRAFPKLGNLRTRKAGGLIVDEDVEDDAPQRFFRLAPKSLRFGIYTPADADAVLQFGKHVFTQAPVHLTLSDLDLDYLDVSFSFELEYRGNHDELIAETLLGSHPLVQAMSTNQTTIIDCQPFLGVTLSADAEQQLTVEVKARTTAVELRENEYETRNISVVLAARQYWMGESIGELVKSHRQLVTTAARFASDRIIPHIVQPLAAAIASRR